MSTKKSTKKKVNRGNSCEHKIPKSKKCSKCANIPVCEHGVKANTPCRKCYPKLAVEKVTKKLSTSEKRKQLMEAVQSIVDRPHLREDIEAKDTTAHVMNFGELQVPYLRRDIKVPDDYTITLKPTLVGDEEVDIPIFKHKKLFKIEVEESKSDWPMLYVTGLIQGIALAACVWMIHKLNINWHEIL